jgi:hypothetical protein
MSAPRRAEHTPRWLPWAVLSAAGVLLLGSAAYVASSVGTSIIAPGMTQAGPAAGLPSTYDAASAAQTYPGRGTTGTTGTLRTRVWLTGDGVPVMTPAAARARARAAATPSRLHPGEVMQFSDSFYVQLKDDSEVLSAEVLVDPATGAVFTEYGPAMTWTSRATAYPVSPERAVVLANAWLQTNAPGQSVSSADLFPGHYTMATVSAGKIVGLVSVNATTGAVWYLTWHGPFVAKEDR